MLESKQKGGKSAVSDIEESKGQVSEVCKAKKEVEPQVNPEQENFVKGHCEEVKEITMTKDKSLTNKQLHKVNDVQRNAGAQKKVAAKKVKSSQSKAQTKQIQKYEPNEKSCFVCGKSFDIKGYKLHFDTETGFICKALGEKGFLLCKIKSLLNKENLFVELYHRNKCNSCNRQFNSS